MTKSLSATATTPKSTSRSLLWAIQASGDVVSVTASGIVSNARFPVGWTAERIAASPQGYLWVVARDSLNGTVGVWFRGEDTAAWRQVTTLTGMVQIAAARSGAWLLAGRRLEQLDEDGKVQRSHVLPVDALDVCEGGDGSLWFIGGEPRIGGRPIHRLDARARTWMEFPAPVAAVQISCAPDGTAWTTNSKGQVWRFHPDGPGHFSECVQRADCRKCLKSPAAQHITHVSVGPDGQIWCLTDKPLLEGAQVVRLLPGRLRTAELPTQVGAVRIAASTSP